ncbi:MAG TPA: antitoxin [Streptomyces sp.]
MGLLDRFKNNQAMQDKAKDLSDTAEKMINEKTGNKYESQVDQVQQKAEEALGIQRDDPDQR